MAFAANSLQTMISSRAELQPTAEILSGGSPSRLPANSGVLSAFEVLFTQQLAAHLPQPSSSSAVPSKAASTSGAPTAASPSLPADAHKPSANDDNTAVYSLLNPLLISQTPSRLPKFDLSLADLFSSTDPQLAATVSTSIESGDVFEESPLTLGPNETEFSADNQPAARSTAQTSGGQVAGQDGSATSGTQVPSPTLFNQALTGMASVGAQITIPQGQSVTITNGTRPFNSPTVDAQTVKSSSAVSAGNRANIDVSRFESVSLHVRAQDLPLPVQKSLKNFNEPNFVNAYTARVDQLINDVTPNQNPSIAYELAAEIERQLRETEESGPTTIELNIDRPEWGRVRVILSLRGKSVAIRITVQNAEAQRLINSELGDLQQSLASSGIDCHQFVVGCNDSLTDGNRQSEKVASRRSYHDQNSSAPMNRRNDRLSFVV